MRGDPAGTGSCAIVGGGELLFHRGGGEAQVEQDACEHHKMQTLTGLSLREFREAVVRQLGVIRNLSKVFLDSVSAEHQAGIGECFSALDVQKGMDARRP